MTQEKLEELQSEVYDLSDEVSQIAKCVECAHSCETGRDFEENLRDAINALNGLTSDLKSLLARC